MLYLKSFIFNPFQENTYVLFNDDADAIIVDPGNSNATENKLLQEFIRQKQLKPQRLLLTHGHIDHILGNRFVFDTYGLLPELHHDDLFFVQKMADTAAMYGISCDPSPEPVLFLKPGDEIRLGGYTFNCLHTPGHSPGSLSFYCAGQKLVLGGDVLFNGSIGRSDLPMGNHETLIASIRGQLLVLNDEVKVYSGHGPVTTIGAERHNNPFLV